MNPVEILVTAASPALVVIGAVIGWFKSLLTRRDKKIDVLEATLEAKDDIIDELKDRNTRLEVTAQIQEHFFKQLPGTRDLPFIEESNK